MSWLIAAPVWHRGKPGDGVGYSCRLAIYLYVSHWEWWIGGRKSWTRYRRVGTPDGPDNGYIDDEVITQIAFCPTLILEFHLQKSFGRWLFTPTETIWYRRFLRMGR